jgi:hypothetical protein
MEQRLRAGVGVTTCVSKGQAASVAEWLRRQTQVLVLFEGVSSNLTGCNCPSSFLVYLHVLQRSTASRIPRGQVNTHEMHSWPSG